MLSLFALEGFTPGFCGLSFERSIPVFFKLTADAAFVEIVGLKFTLIFCFLVLTTQIFNNTFLTGYLL